MAFSMRTHEDDFRCIAHWISPLFQCLHFLAQRTVSRQWHKLMELTPQQLITILVAGLSATRKAVSCHLQILSILHITLTLSCSWICVTKCNQLLLELWIFQPLIATYSWHARGLYWMVRDNTFNTVTSCRAYRVKIMTEIQLIMNHAMKSFRKKPFKLILYTWSLWR